MAGWYTKGLGTHAGSPLAMQLARLTRPWALATAWHSPDTEGSMLQNGVRAMGSWSPCCCMLSDCTISGQTWVRSRSHVALEMVPEQFSPVRSAALVGQNTQGALVHCAESSPEPGGVDEEAGVALTRRNRVLGRVRRARRKLPLVHALSLKRGHVVRFPWQRASRTSSRIRLATIRSDDRRNGTPKLLSGCMLAPLVVTKRGGGLHAAQRRLACLYRATVSPGVRGARLRRT